MALAPRLLIRNILVGQARFELAISCSQSRRNKPDYPTDRFLDYILGFSHCQTIFSGATGGTRTHDVGTLRMCCRRRWATVALIGAPSR